MLKFILTLDKKERDTLQNIAQKKGITIQALIKTVIIPEWLHKWKD